jgi:hypothetical protein
MRHRLEEAWAAIKAAGEALDGLGSEELECEQCDVVFSEGFRPRGVDGIVGPGSKWKGAASVCPSCLIEEMGRLALEIATSIEAGRLEAAAAVAALLGEVCVNPANRMPDYAVAAGRRVLFRFDDQSLTASRLRAMEAALRADKGR